MIKPEIKRLGDELEEYKHFFLREAIATRHLKLVAAELGNKVASLEERLSAVCKTLEVKAQPVAMAQPEVKPPPQAKPAPEVKAQPEVKPPPQAKPAPEVKAQPEVKPPTQAKPAPEVKAQPEVKQPPQAKPAPAAPPAAAPTPPKSAAPGGEPSFSELSARIMAQAQELIREIGTR